jgi:hypothetical protein
MPTAGIRFLNPASNGNLNFEITVLPDACRAESQRNMKGAMVVPTGAVVAPAIAPNARPSNLEIDDPQMTHIQGSFGNYGKP